MAGTDGQRGPPAATQVWRTASENFYGTGVSGPSAPAPLPRRTLTRATAPDGPYQGWGRPGVGTRGRRGTGPSRRGGRDEVPHTGTGHAGPGTAGGAECPAWPVCRDVAGSDGRGRRRPSGRRGSGGAVGAGRRGRPRVGSAPGRGGGRAGARARRRGGCRRGLDRLGGHRAARAEFLAGRA